MLRLVFEKGTHVILKTVLKAMNDHCKINKLVCTENGVSLEAMSNNNNNASMSLFFRSDRFSQYTCVHPRTFYFPVTNILQILKYTDKKDIATLEAAEGAVDLTFIFRSEEGDNTFRFEMHLIDIDVNFELPNIQYVANVRMPSALFARIFHDLNIFDDYVNIDVNQIRVQFSIRGGIGNVQITSEQIEEMADQGAGIQLMNPINVTLSLRYLKTVKKLTALSKLVKIRLSDEFVLFEFTIAQMSGHVRFYVTPIIV